MSTKRYLRTDEGDVTSFTSEGGVHQFFNSRDAYDACQCDETVKNGDTLIIESEGVVGVADTWPIAVTVASGGLHTKSVNTTWEELAKVSGLSMASIAMAVGEARALGYEVQA
jgi:hypothetical protein